MQNYSSPLKPNTCLNLTNLSVSVKHNSRSKHLLKNVCLNIEQGKTAGLVGSSGCGKTLTALAILNLLPDNFVCHIDDIIFENRTLPDPDKDIPRLRGSKISIIFQDATAALNPVIPIGRQLTDIITTHQNMTQKEAQESAIENIRSVGLNDAGQVFKSYPHQLSGGMAQRIMIAMSLCCGPGLIIADEPTTALDMITQKQILNLLKDLQQKRKFSLLFISHDIDIISRIADIIYVMKEGHIIHQGRYDQLLNLSADQYTRALLNPLSRQQ